MNTAYICLGSNLGDRARMLGEAVRLIRKMAGTVKTMSAIYESPAWGSASGNKYLNQVIELHTSFAPDEVLSVMMMVEKQLGRTRTAVRNSDRTIDLDVLFYGQLVRSDENLHIPHPRLHLRRFVLCPLNEIAPALKHPVLDLTVSELLAVCPDQLQVRRLR